MANELLAIQSDFEKLAERLAALIEFHIDDPVAAPHIDRLRAAQQKAVQGAEMLRGYRQTT